ncbi:MAG: hypothetical protein WD557_08160 [Dehalococcoidia bacterium]
MAEADYRQSEAFNTSLRLATAVGRLKVGSNLKAAADAQTRAFEQAGMAAALIAEATTREGPAQIGLYRDARGSLAQTRAWLHVLASVMNEQDALFGNELDMAEQASRQIGATIRMLDRGPGAGPRPAPRGPSGPPQRQQGPRPGGVR